MTKVKRILLIIGISLLSLTLVSGVALLFGRHKKVEYKITYVAIQKGVQTDIHPDLYKRGGNYPLEYTSGTEVAIDDLRDYIWVGAYEDRVFQGWFLDSNCTEEFDGTIDKDEIGNITLYAKISVGYWTPNY